VLIGGHSMQLCSSPTPHALLDMYLSARPVVCLICCSALSSVPGLCVYSVGSCTGVCVYSVYRVGACGTVPCLQNKEVLAWPSNGAVVVCAGLAIQGICAPVDSSQFSVESWTAQR
jgi:hypothetical protein